MIDHLQRIQCTLEAMTKMIQVLEGLRNEGLEKNPQLFAVLAEAPLDELSRMKLEIDDHIQKLKKLESTKASA